MIWISLIVIAIILIPLIIEATRKKMGPRARRNAPGDFADLSQGKTHFTWQGPENGPVAVCVHGLTTPSFVWRGVAAGLVAMGFRVLTYDLYGRGFSDRPRGPQDRAFFRKQLNDLLDHEGITGRFTLVGYSMGGAIATSYASTHPDRIDRLILLAPAGAFRLKGRMMQLILKGGAFGTWLMLAIYPFQLRQGIAKERKSSAAVPEINDLQEAELDWRGFVPAVLSSLRGMLSDWLEAEHRTIAAEGLPILVIWGRDDDVVPLSSMDRILEWNPESDHRVIDGVGHWLTYSHPTEVVIFIRDFLAEGN